MQLKPLFFLFCLTFSGLHLSAQIRPNKEETPKTAPVKTVFEPETDPIGLVQRDGSFLLTTSEALLSKSLKKVFPDVGIIQKVIKQKIHNGDFIVFECRNIDTLEKSLYIAIPLKKAENGQVFIAEGYHTCSGSPCSNCKFSANGCVCEEQAPADNPTQIGRCNHTVSSRVGLAKVSVAQD
jgi:hypothetical protein